LITFGASGKTWMAESSKGACFSGAATSMRSAVPLACSDAVQPPRLRGSFARAASNSSPQRESRSGFVRLDAHAQGKVALPGMHASSRQASQRADACDVDVHAFGTDRRRIDAREQPAHRRRSRR
jgi:hypothetical protein